MISQADIIRTLVNRNCTDESVMSTALSPDCTPLKLLEKLTESERFDLALDISMKLGLDVTPLWRIWAMRCLRSRNFQGAREKFRHCFVRSRMPGARCSPLQSRLLSDILAELARMEETQISLREEIELIKRRESPMSNNALEGCHPPDTTLKHRPKVFSECIFYLNEYGSVEDKVRFYVRNSLWDEATKILLEKLGLINIDKFFLNEVVQYTTTTGQLSNLITAFLKFEPTMTASTKYFKALYHFCNRNRRYNLLYYIQSTISDHVAAAKTQIDHFFLKRPAQSYRELNHRISSLVNARKNFQDYLDKLKNKSARSKPGPVDFVSMPIEEAENQLTRIDLQIDITRNFAINEVSGLEISVDIDSSGTEEKSNGFPVTLFDTSDKRKTFLAALVLIYYDLSCSTYFSRDGLELANQLIRDCGLDKLRVFKTAMRIIIEDESCDIIANATLMLERIKEDYLAGAKREKQGGKQSKPARHQSGLGGQGQKSKTSRSFDANSGNTGTSAPLAPGSVLPDRQQANTTTAMSPNSTLSDEVRGVCDEVIRDAIRSCREPDYKMELAKLLSGEAKIKLYIEHGKLSNAQSLACMMNRPDYVAMIIEEATRLNQNHIKTVCQLWLAKHETRNSKR